MFGPVARQPGLRLMNMCRRASCLANGRLSYVLREIGPDLVVIHFEGLFAPPANWLVRSLSCWLGPLADGTEGQATRRGESREYNSMQATLVRLYSISLGSPRAKFGHVV